MSLPEIYTFIDKAELEKYIQFHNAHPEAGTILSVKLTQVEVSVDDEEWATKVTLHIGPYPQDVWLKAFREKTMKTYKHIVNAIDNLRSSGWYGDITIEGVVKLQEPFSDLV